MGRVELLAEGALTNTGWIALPAGRGAPPGGWITPLVERAGVPGALRHLQWPVQLGSAAGGVVSPTS